MIILDNEQRPTPKTIHVKMIRGNIAKNKIKPTIKSRMKNNKNTGKPTRNIPTNEKTTKQIANAKNPTMTETKKPTGPDNDLPFTIIFEPEAVRREYTNRTKIATSAMTIGQANSFIFFPLLKQPFYKKN